MSEGWSNRSIFNHEAGDTLEFLHVVRYDNIAARASRGGDPQISLADALPFRFECAADRDVMSYDVVIRPEHGVGLDEAVHLGRVLVWFGAFGCSHSQFRSHLHRNKHFG